MSAIILPDRWRRQPTGAIQLDKSQGALFAYSAGVVYTQSGVIFPNHTSTGGLEATPWGSAHKLNGGSNVQRFDTKQTVSGADPFTLEFLAYTTGAVSLGVYATLSNYAGGAGHEHKVNYSVVEPGAMRGDLPYTGSSPFDINWWNGEIAVDTNISHRTNSLDHYVFTKAAGTSSPRLSIYRNGELLSQASPAGAWNTSGPYFYIGGVHEGGTTSLTGWVIESVVHRRELSAGEVQERTRAPWAVFKKSARILYFPSAAGGAYTLTAGSGSFSLTGTAATLKVGRVLSCGSGSFALSGTAATLKAGRLLSAASGTYAVSGTAADLRKSSILAATSGSFALTGTAATLTYTPAGSYSLSADSGSYTLNGTTVALKVGRILPAASGSYAFTGTNVTLSRGRTMAAASGSFALTGTNISFARSYVLTASSGSFALSGSDVSLTYSGAPVVVPPTTGGGGGPMIIKERGLRDELARIRKEREAAALRRQIQREDEEIVLIMAALAA